MADSGKRSRKRPPMRWVGKDRGVFSIFDVCQSRDVKYLREYLDKGGNPDLQQSTKGNTLLWIACNAPSESRFDHVKLLLERGADPNKLVQYHDETPLYTACRWGNVHRARLLLEHGANVNQPNKRGVTPLHIASITDHVECVRLLVEHGADVNVKEQEGKTPLHLACYCGNPECVRLLLTGDIEIDATDPSGYTAIFMACLTGKVSCLELLLEHGADASIPNAIGQTPETCAEEQGYTECVEVLRKV